MTIICPCCGEEICDEFVHCPVCKFEVEKYRNEPPSETKDAWLAKSRAAYSIIAAERRVREEQELEEERRCQEERQCKEWERQEQEKLLREEKERRKENRRREKARTITCPLCQTEFKLDAEPPEGEIIECPHCSMSFTHVRHRIWKMLGVCFLWIVSCSVLGMFIAVRTDSMVVPFGAIFVGVIGGLYSMFKLDKVGAVCSFALGLSKLGEELNEKLNEKLVCVNCGTIVDKVGIGERAVRTVGNVISSIITTAIVLLVIFVICLLINVVLAICVAVVGGFVGLFIISSSGSKKIKRVCPKCGSENLILTTTPRGKKLVLSQSWGWNPCLMLAA